MSVTYLENVVLPCVEGLLLMIDFIRAGDRCERPAATFLQQVVEVLPIEAVVLILGGAQRKDGKSVSDRKVSD